LSTTNLFSNEAAERYSLALFEIGKENSKIDSFEEDTNKILNYFKADMEFKNFIKNPSISIQNQFKAFDIISRKMQLGQEFSNFLKVVIDKRRIFFLDKILKTFLRLVSKKKGEINVFFTSSKKIGETEISKIKKDFAKIIGSQIKFVFNVDETLISGIKIQIGSLMIDTSIRSKLNNLKLTMTEN
jgi:F-type H+-transporting ATPase subunit delta|tara:strand:- start:31 stop:588 length:558 start_codon:yes stop_codon:yes gene_type:complete